MKNCCLFSMILFLMISCTGSPELVPIQQPLPPNGDRRCMTPFPNRDRQFVHSIHASMPGGQEAVVIGITSISPRTGAVACVMMTVEGLVLFDARYDGRIVIHRALPPFDSMAFARGLMDDIHLIFFPPKGPLVTSGMSEDGAWVCRYRTEEGTMADIVIHEDHSWEIRQYNHDLRLIRSVVTDPAGKKTSGRESALPVRLKLAAFGLSEYALTLDLIEARESSE
jgi:hypothetical protein